MTDFLDGRGPSVAGNTLERRAVSDRDDNRGYALVDLTGSIRHHNRELGRALGLGAADVTIDDLLAPADGSECRTTMSSMIDEAVDARCAELRWITASGGVVWFATTITPVRDGQGNVVHFEFELEDITTRKVQERALLEERRRLREAQRVGGLGSWEVDVATGEVTWSDMIFELYGLRREDFACQLDDALECIHPEDRAAVSSALAECAESGIAMQIQYRVIRRDDGAARNFHARGQRLGGNEPTRLVGTAADVTDVVEQVRVEAESRATVEFQQAVLAATSDTIFIYDVPSQAVTWSNRPLDSLLGGAPMTSRKGRASGFDGVMSTAGRAGFDVAVLASCASQDGEVTEHDFEVTVATIRDLRLSVRMTPFRRDLAGAVVQLSGALRDVTELFRAGRALADSEQRFRSAFSTAPMGMSMIDLTQDGGIVQVNTTLCEMLNRSDADLLASDLQSITHPGEAEAVQAILTQLRTLGKDPVRTEIRSLQANGRVVWCELAASVVPIVSGPPTYAICLLADITARKEAETALRHLGMHDSLTGLPNRLLIRDRIEHGLAAAVRSGHPLGIIYLDLDGFKAVNDSDGHATGDGLLIDVTARLKRSVRPGDTVGRLGGDEFGVLCLDVEDVDALRIVAARLLETVREPFTAESGQHHLTVSIGLSLSTDRSSADQLLADADAAMLVAKNTGKNRIAMPRPEDQARASRAARLGTELGRALAEDELVMHGQPVLNLATGYPVAVETLIRWNHPQRGLLPPSEFLDAVENGPLMGAVGQRVLRESCRMAAAWCEHLGATAPDLHVNVSGRQLESGSLIADILTTLETYALPANRLILELTETHMPALNSSLLADLTELRSRGVRIAIDDIGTGYSSLSRLTELPVDILKIDLKFIAGLGRDPACQAVVRAVLSLGKEMGLSVVAEGVETPAQAALLADYGCDTVQGYLFSAPRPELELLQYLGDCPHGWRPSAKSA